MVVQRLEVGDVLVEGGLKDIDSAGQGDINSVV
jgi:hypothetical protein